MSLSWKDLYISALNTNEAIKNKYVDLIKGSSDSVKPGEILAIMGPSGGGKSTLLNALAGHIPVGSITQGSITYNNKPRNSDTWFNEIGYVKQEMYLLDDLTVMETLFYYHQFNDQMIIKTRNNKEYKISVNEKIRKIIQYLGLEKVGENLVKKLSGGERKRVNIGTILVNNPSILFLDEPTSGLDAMTSLKIIEILKKLAIEQQKIIILTLHQPSLEIFLMFNNLILLSEGNVMFQGKTDGVEKYFIDLGIKRDKDHTLPEYILNICSRDFKFNNPDLFNNEDGIFKDNCVIKDKNRMKTSNDFQLTFIPSLFHVLILLRRRFDILKRNKWAFTKIISIPLIFNVFIIVNMIDSYISEIGNIDIASSNSDHINNDLYNKQMKFRGRNLYLGLILPNSIPFLIATTQFIKELELVNPELSHHCYSSASFYFYAFLFFLIQNCFFGISYFSLFWTSFKIMNLNFPLIFLFGFIFNLTFSLFVSIIIPTNTLMPVFNITCGILIQIPSGLIGKLKNYLAAKIPSIKFITNLTPLFAIFSPFCYSALFGHKISKNEGEIETIEFLKCSLDFLEPIPFKIGFLYIMLFVFFFIYLIIGCLMMAVKTNPNTRLEMEKK